MVGIQVSLWDGLFSGAMLVSGRVYRSIQRKQSDDMTCLNAPLRIVFFVALRCLGHHFFQHRFMTDFWNVLSQIHRLHGINPNK